jgi:hypothetical protein
VKKALEAYGYEPGEKLKVYQTDVTTHNDLTFSIYTDKVSKITTAKTQNTNDQIGINVMFLLTSSRHITDEDGATRPSFDRAS